MVFGWIVIAQVVNLWSRSVLSGEDLPLRSKFRLLCVNRAEENRLILNEIELSTHHVVPRNILSGGACSFNRLETSSIEII